MNECWMCGKALEPDGADRHASCGAELVRRMRDGMCTMCGKREQAADHTKCEECIGVIRSTGVMEYQGYPGA